MRRKPSSTQLRKTVPLALMADKFGYTCREIEELMPAPIQYAHAILCLFAEARKSAAEPTLGPDAKSQLSLRYANGQPAELTSIVLSIQHTSKRQSKKVIRRTIESYTCQILPEGWITKKAEWQVNPMGTLVIGEPDGDAGLTGPKIIVDTSGGAASHGGGEFSGRDPIEVDRWEAYAARYLAKNVAATGLAYRCTIQISDATGMENPLSMYVEKDDTGRMEDAAIERAISSVMDLTPRGILEHLSFTRPIYARTSAYGHFSRAPEADGGFSWERTDLVEAIKKAVSALT